MPRKKRKAEEEHENMERWLVSYADFITLLFAFFVTMYAISRVDEQKLGSAVESLQRALGSLIPVQISQRNAGAFTSGPDHPQINILIVPEVGQKTREQEASEKLAEELQRELERVIGEMGSKGSALRSQIKYIVEKRGLTIRVPEAFFFSSGDASLKPDVFPVLNALAKSLEKIPNHIRIEGHTDSVPIKTVFFCLFSRHD
jgi:chemotaxis protein MotB